MEKEFDLIKESIRGILKENKDATSRKVFTALVMMRLIENNQNSLDIVDGIVNEIRTEKTDSYDDNDIISILKNPAHLKKIIAESKKTAVGRMTLKTIVDLVESEPEELKQRLGEQKFYLIKTELANNSGMLGALNDTPETLSESAYWERKH
jgi:hypothetical protein